MVQEVVLVDDNDHQIGVEEKLRAHQNGGKLHRAISVFVFNSKGETMIQQRAAHKYHAQSMWANSCCSHPEPGEKPIDAGHRRLKEEMGFDCEMKEIFNFKYVASVGNDLTEREYDHIIFGKYEDKPTINRDEVSDWKWMEIHKLRDEVKRKPELFAPWLVLMIDDVVRHYDSLNKKKSS